MDFDKIKDYDSLEMSYISKLSGGYISKNKYIFDSIELNDLNRFILKKCVYGTPIFKLGSGGNKILVLSGIHGNELPPQLANLNLINQLIDRDINNTIFFIPIAAPKSTMYNERSFNARDLNRSAHIKNSLSNLIIQAIEKLKIDFVGDFHSTAYNSNPGFDAIFSTKYPTFESFLIGSYVSKSVMTESIVYKSAGEPYNGAIEDECNLNGVPAITGEVLSPFARIGQGSADRSLAQMKSFLDYFGL